MELLEYLIKIFQVLSYSAITQHIPQSSQSHHKGPLKLALWLGTKQYQAVAHRAGAGGITQ